MAAKLDAGALRALPRAYNLGPQCRSLARPFRSAGSRRPQARHASSLRAPQTSRHGRPTAIPAPSLAVAGGRASRKNYATAPPRNIAVLGGGMTGLATAYYLTRFVPEAKITLYEASGRLGGWVDTEKVAVRGPDGEEKTVLFERGARGIQAQYTQYKWDDLVLYELIDALALKSQVLVSPRGLRVPRYIYYPDHLVDVTAPYFDPTRDPFGTLGSLLSFAQKIFTEPVYTGLLPSLINAGLDSGRQAQAAQARAARAAAQGNPGSVPVVGQQDESLGDYFLRKFGRRDLVDNILSAVVHGTQGGDVWKTSIASSMYQRFLVKDRLGVVPGTVLALLDDVHVLNDIAKNNEAVRELAAESANWGFVSFDGGFSTLTDKMAVELENNPNVTVLLNEPVEHVKNHQTQRIEITTSKSQEPAYYDKVVSTLFSKTLASLTDNLLPSLAAMHAVNIYCVNLWYPTPNLNAPYHGFGYILPGSVPAANNPEAALGVLFDTDREAVQLPLDPAHDQDPTDPAAKSAGAGGTKLTVLLGGHHWDGLPDSFIPDHDSAIAAAQSVVSRHLGIPPEVAANPGAASAKFCRECIPQHLVGHTERLAAARDDLESAFAGRLAVAGASYSSPGVLPGLRAARDVASQIAGRFRLPPGSGRGGEEQPWSVGDTGLAGLTEKMWSRWPRGQLPYVKGSPWRPLRTDGEGAGEKEE